MERTSARYIWNAVSLYFYSKWTTFWHCYFTNGYCSLRNWLPWVWTPHHAQSRGLILCFLKKGGKRHGCTGPNEMTSADQTGTITAVSASKDTGVLPAGWPAACYWLPRGVVSPSVCLGRGTLAIGVAGGAGLSLVVPASCCVCLRWVSHCIWGKVQLWDVQCCSKARTGWVSQKCQCLVGLLNFPLTNAKEFLWRWTIMFGFRTT